MHHCNTQTTYGHAFEVWNETLHLSDDCKTFKSHLKSHQSTGVHQLNKMNADNNLSTRVIANLTEG